MNDTPRISPEYCAICGKPFLAIGGLLVCQPCLEKRPKPKPAEMSTPNTEKLPFCPP